MASCGQLCAFSHWDSIKTAATTWDQSWQPMKQTSTFCATPSQTNLMLAASAPRPRYLTSACPWERCLFIWSTTRPALCWHNYNSDLLQNHAKRKLVQMIQLVRVSICEVPDAMKLQCQALLSKRLRTTICYVYFICILYLFCIFLVFCMLFVFVLYFICIFGLYLICIL